MKTTGVVPEAFAASISLLSRSEMDAMPNSSRSQWKVSGESYEPASFRRRTGGVGTDQLEKVWPRSQRYSRYRPNSRELPVGDAGAWQMVQRRPPVLMCAPYSRRP